MRINVGDVIEYIARVPVHGNLTDQVQTRRGRVIQITDRFITIQGDRYPETILVNDIRSGKAKFLRLVTSDGEVYELKRITRYSHIDWVTIAEQAQSLVNDKEISLYKAATLISKDIKVPAGTVYNRLKAAGLAQDSLKDPEPENINPQGGDLVDNKTNDQVNVEVYMNPITTLNELKKKWIQDVLETALPTKAQMAIIERIISLEGVA